LPIRGGGGEVKGKKGTTEQRWGGGVKGVFCEEKGCIGPSALVPMKHVRALKKVKRQCVERKEGLRK